MKKTYTTLLSLLVPMLMMAQGWPANYGGVMLQGFYWDSFEATKWTNLTAQADELAATFNLIWVPQSGNCGDSSMGYDDLYWFPGGNHYTSSFGTEQELRTMIQTFKNKGLGTIADVVINHRKNVSNWVDFPSETYKGVTYQMISTDICRDDDGGKALNWANSNGYQLSRNKDTGEGWDGMRDLDHNSTNVQNICKAYTKMLLDDFGYTGFRYDMTKGFYASFIRDYNNYARPTFSVGENWDGNADNLKTWINDAEKTSATFDFPFRYTVRDAINGNNWQKLGNKSLASEASYRQYAVTFVENHDTERRSNAEQDPLKEDTLAANAFMLAMPGTPCVFMKHWLAYKNDIKAMIAVRKAAGITNTSSYTNMRSNVNYYANLIKDNAGNNALQVVVGSDLNTYVPANYTKVLSGYHYAYYMPNSMETAWADKADGEYTGSVDVMLSAVSAKSTQLAYTTDGSTPTVASTKVSSGSKITISQSCTLKAGLFANGSVSNVITRNYTIAEAKAITVHVNANAVSGWSTMNFWTWGGDGTHSPAYSSWPGDRITATKTVGGKTWYYKQFSINSSSDFVNFVFSADTGSPQSVNVENVNTDRFFEVVNEKDGSNNYKVNDVTGSYTAINDIRTDWNNGRQHIYTLDGRMMPATDINSLPRGIYIAGGKKIIKE